MDATDRPGQIRFQLYFSRASNPRILPGQGTIDIDIYNPGAMPREQFPFTPMALRKTNGLSAKRIRFRTLVTKT